MIDIIVPTMWMVEDFVSTIESYTKHPMVNKIIIIDNAQSKRPNAEILKHSKVKLICYGRNIFVNPAWNEGYYQSTSHIIAIINDDVKVAPDVFDMVVAFDLKPGDLIGVNLRGYQDNYKIDDHIETAEEIVKLNYDPAGPIGGQAWAFGICMFLLRETYTPIPDLYQLWYGDDYLAQKAKNVYAINSNKIKGTISETLKKFEDPDSDVSRRIELDSKNLLKFDHFTNSKNWDIPKNMISLYASQREQAKFKNLLSEEIDPATFFENEYNKARYTPSDINQNLHILYELAQQCSTVVEMGVRTGVSTRAFLNSNVALLSFDVEMNGRVQQLFDVAKKQGKNVEYIQANVLNVRINYTDLLFLDTWHGYDQLKQELELHGNKAQKYIVMHDTQTFGTRDEGGSGGIGLLPAIMEFLIANPNWRVHTHKTNNNGLTVLERINIYHE